MSGNFAIKGGGVGRLMVNTILNFHFHYWHTSLTYNLFLYLIILWSQILLNAPRLLFAILLEHFVLLISTVPWFLLCTSTTVWFSKTPFTSNIFVIFNASFSKQNTKLFKCFNIFSNPQEFASNLHLFVFKHYQLNRQTNTLRMDQLFRSVVQPCCRNFADEKIFCQSAEYWGLESQHNNV